MAAAAAAAAAARRQLERLITRPGHVSRPGHVMIHVTHQDPPRPTKTHQSVIHVPVLGAVPPNIDDIHNPKKSHHH